MLFAVDQGLLYGFVTIVLPFTMKEQPNNIERLNNSSPPPQSKY